MKILFTGGGTAGHILPIIAIVREMRRILATPSEKEKGGLQFFYLGPKDKFGQILLSKEGIKMKTIVVGKVRRYLGFKEFFQNMIDIVFKTPLGFCQAFLYIFFLAPDLIFSKGGYGSFSTTLAGWILRVPILLHESDVVPGLANRFLSKFTSKIFVSFPAQKTEYLPQRKIISVGNPIRKEILEGSKEKAKELFKLTLEKPIILVLGGSQGAQRINDKILEILPEFLKTFELIHQCGERNFLQVQSEANAILNENLKKYYHLYPFLNEEELKQAYAAADIIVSRAGSGSIFEIAALGKPSILIPLPEAAQNHQIKNAYTFAENGACLVIEEGNFTPHFFLEKLKYLISHQEELEKMGKAAKEFARPQAARIIAESLVNYLTK